MRTFENWADWSTLVSTRNLEQDSAAEQRPRSSSRLRMFLERRTSGNKCVRLHMLGSGRGP